MSVKLTEGQKRGRAPGERGVAVNHGIQDRRSTQVLGVRPPEQLYEVQLKLAQIALDEGKDEAWLSDVLEYLGLDRVMLARSPKRSRICFPYSGLARGYNIHLRSYTKPCEDCARFHSTELSAAQTALGIVTGGDPTWQIG